MDEKGKYTAVLQKLSDDSLYAIAGPKFPTIASPKKWSYSKSQDSIRICDGRFVHQFDLPDHVKGKAAFLTYKTGTSLEKDAERGTARVYSSSPSHIHFTIADGKTNPTYTFRHLRNNIWKATAGKAKEAATLPDSLIYYSQSPGLISNPAVAKVLDPPLKAAYNAGLPAIHGLAHLDGNSAMTNALIGAGLGGAYDFIKRKWYNTPEENKQHTFRDTLTDIAAPAVVMGAGTGLAHSFAPNLSSAALGWKYAE